MSSLEGQQFGNYQLVRQIGRGSFSEVYLCRHLHLQALAAAKILYGMFWPEEKEQFKQEAKIIATFKHPHILRLFEFGIQNAIPYLIMEYAPNGTLRDRYPEGSVVPLPVIISSLQQVASALAYVHRHNHVHCDVKPENMLIDAQGDIIVGDFAIAHPHSIISQRILDPDPLGTIHYMAPEHLEGKPQPASDQYA
jgi:serine/threonine protein kinase